MTHISIMEEEPNTWSTAGESLLSPSNSILAALLFSLEIEGLLVLLRLLRDPWLERREGG